MTSKNIILYPRGFIGFDTGLITDTSSGVDMDDWIRSIKLNKPIAQETSPYKGIPEVDQLWKDYQNGIGFISAFAFREKILVTALKAFGTLSFYDWCNLQNNNVYFTSLHRKYMNDTFKFIQEGSRSIGNTTWQSILSMKPLLSKDKDTAYEMNQFFMLDGPPEFRRSFRLSDTVVTWTQQENGFEDLLVTINILFGTN